MSDPPRCLALARESGGRCAFRAFVIAGLCAMNRPAHRLDEALADGEAEPRAGLAAVGPPAAIEFLEDAFEIGGLYARALVRDGDGRRRRLAPRMDGTLAPAAIFLRIVEQIEEHLAQQIGVAANWRQIAGETGGDRAESGKAFLHSPKVERTTSATSTRSRRGCSAPDSMRDISRRLATKRVSRPASSSIEARRSARSAARHLVAELAQARDGAGDRGERRAQIVRKRREKRRAQFLVFLERRRLDRFLDEQRAIDGDGGLLEDRRQRTFLLSVERLAVSLGSTPRDRDNAAGRHERSKLKAHIGQRAGAPSRRLVFFERPARRDRLAGIELIDRRPGGANDEIALLGNEKGDALDPSVFWAWMVADYSTSSTRGAPDNFARQFKERLGGLSALAHGARLIAHGSRACP